MTLGNLTLADLNWLTIAFAHLIRIDESRRAENARGNSYCVFEGGRAYFAQSSQLAHAEAIRTPLAQVNFPGSFR